MKRWRAVVFVLACVFGLVGCNTRSMNDIIKNEPSIMGIVKKTNNNSILVENDSDEYWVSLKVENRDSIIYFNIGDEVVIYYDGNIAESYPMQINKVYAITLRTPVDRNENEEAGKNSEMYNKHPGATRFIVEIIDRVEEENLYVAEAKEKFYEDEKNKYYFNVIKSHYIVVIYNNGESEDIVTALTSGRATITNLDEFGIEYFIEPKINLPFRNCVADKKYL